MIRAQAGIHGHISPAGNISVARGGSQSFTITPDAGYRIAVLNVDNATVTSVGTYTFTNVQADHVIVVAFEQEIVPHADTVPPSAPAGLTARRVSNGITVGWNASTDNVGVSGYKVRIVRRSSGRPITGYSSRDVGNVLTHRVRGLSAGVSYCATVRAYDAAQNISASSARVCARAGN